MIPTFAVKLDKERFLYNIKNSEIRIKKNIKICYAIKTFHPSNYYSINLIKKYRLLKFNYGEIIIVTNTESNNGWIFGFIINQKNIKIGRIPSNYLAKLKLIKEKKT